MRADIFTVGVLTFTLVYFTIQVIVAYFGGYL